MIMFIDTAPERDANGRGGGVERKGIEQRARKLQQWEKGERKQKYPVGRRVRSVINRFLFEAALIESLPFCERKYKQCLSVERYFHRGKLKKWRVLKRTEGTYLLPNYWLLRGSLTLHGWSEKVGMTVIIVSRYPIGLYRLQMR